MSYGDVHKRCERSQTQWWKSQGTLFRSQSQALSWRPQHSLNYQFLIPERSRHESSGHSPCSWCPWARIGSCQSRLLACKACQHINAKSNALVYTRQETLASHPDRRLKIFISCSMDVCMLLVAKNNYTTLNVWNSINNRIKDLPNGVGFQRTFILYTAVHLCAKLRSMRYQLRTPLATKAGERCILASVLLQRRRCTYQRCRNRVLPWKYLRITPPTHDHAKSSTNWEYWMNWAVTKTLLI